MRKGWVGGGIVAAGAVLAATLGTGFVVAGFGLIFLGALVLAVALEPLVAAGPPPLAETSAVPDVEATGSRVAA